MHLHVDVAILICMYSNKNNFSLPWLSIISDPIWRRRVSDLYDSSSKQPISSAQKPKKGSENGVVGWGRKYNACNRKILSVVL